MKAISFSNSLLYVDTGKISFNGMEWGVDEGSSLTGCITVNDCGKVALMDDKKKLYILMVADGNISLLKSFFIEKAAMKLSFYCNGLKILVGDKMGDIYSYDLENDDKKLLHGCVSMLTDLAVFDSGKMVLMSDRDEKIRIFSLDKPYEIEGFLLGHTEYVYGFTLIGEKVLSVGGDNRIILWDTSKMTILDSILIPGAEKDPIGISSNKNGDFVIIFSSEMEIVKGSIICGGEKISPLDTSFSLPSSPVSLDCDGENFIISLESKIVKINKNDNVIEELCFPSSISSASFKKQEHLRKMKCD